MTASLNVTKETVSFIRVSSQDTVPIKNGQLIFRTDTGKIELDESGRRVSLGPIVGVDSLPSTPDDKIYLCNNNFWAYDSSSREWIQLGGPIPGQCSDLTANNLEINARISINDGTYQYIDLNRYVANYLRIYPPKLTQVWQKVELQVDHTLKGYFSIVGGQGEYGTTPNGGNNGYAPYGEPVESWLVTFYLDMTNRMRWTVQPLLPQYTLFT